MAQRGPAPLGAAVLVEVKLASSLPPDDARELVSLAESAGARPCAVLACRRTRPDPRLLIGSGKAQELLEMAQSSSASCVIFSCSLSPTQERNLERMLGVRVMDRTALILEIFARRALTHEGQLQVELALLEHEQTRLVRGWTHLERQKGGFGLRGGPGETQIELDRRVIRDRIAAIRGELQTVRRRRAQNRRKRRRNAMPVVALVGYTNAGKSTLFNRLTHAAVYTADQLFATLDPTLRSVELGTAGRVALADTVGFIRQLPHELVAAFRATLEETALADLLLHVVDASDEGAEHHIEAVDEVLRQIGAGHIPQILVFNKSDLVEGTGSDIVYDGRRQPDRVWVSAQTGQGLEELLRCINLHLTAHFCAFAVSLAHEDGRLRALLYDCGAVVGEYPRDDGLCTLELHISPEDAARIDKLTEGRLGRLCPQAALPWQ